MAENEQPVGFPHILLQGKAKTVPIVYDNLQEFTAENDEYDDEEYIHGEDCPIDCEECQEENEAVAFPVATPVQQAPVDLTPDTKKTPNEFQYGLGFVQKFFQDNPNEIAKQAPKPQLYQPPGEQFEPTVVYQDDQIIATTHFIALRPAAGGGKSVVRCRRCMTHAYVIGLFTAENAFENLKAHIHMCYGIPDPGAAAKKQAAAKAAADFAAKIAQQQEEFLKHSKYCQQKTLLWHAKCNGHAEYHDAKIDCICKCHKEEFPDEVI